MFPTMYLYQSALQHEQCSNMNDALFVICNWLMLFRLAGCDDHGNDHGDECQLVQVCNIGMELTQILQYTVSEQCPCQ